MDKNYKINRFNEKLIRNCIAGSLFLGGSAIFTTQIQGTQPVPGAEQNIHRYNQEATEKLRKLRLELASLEKCIELVREEDADPNVEVGILTLLEEAVLRRSPKAVEVFIEKGANVNRIVCEKEVWGAMEKDDKVIIVDVKERYGRRLLHLAVYDPEKAAECLNAHIKNIGLKNLQEVTPMQCCASSKIVELLLNKIRRTEILRPENGSTSTNPLNLAYLNRKKISDGIKEGKYNKNIEKEAEDIIDLLHKFAPPETPPSRQRIPSWVKPSRLCLLRH
ncbi:MAG: hypothetical protein LBI77_04070 [Puniceicoccales bacterium]|nr:hypothetical protein [Puniceicoccales bacterium]